MQHKNKKNYSCVLGALPKEVKVMLREVLPKGALVI
jgi:hypothetical protein